MNKRPLGRTGHHSTVVVFGTAAFWDIDQAGANTALDLALEHGVNHIDVAPQYGKAQTVLGPWLEGHRDKFFLGCKTLERSYDGAWRELRESLKLLRTDVIDLHQLHAVCTVEDLDRVFADDGAMRAFIEAREQGLIRHIGITGHGMLAPAVHSKALERFDFDSVMFPLNPRLYADADYRRDAERLLQTAAERGVGVLIIKSIAKGPWGDKEKTYGPWYEPYATRDEIARSVRFVLSQPVTAIVSAADVRLLPPIFDAVEPFVPLDNNEQTALVECRAADVLIF
ncbi:MAG: aldo/keto reductase [Anaerolineae bacterium]|nr:aldo/keto reductase [Anaerolineae bacterium]